MTIPIDKGIPIPPLPKGAGTRASNGRPPSYPWRDMEVGDSFFAPGMSSSTGVPNTKHLSMTMAKLLLPGTEWTMRTVVKGGVRGVRVWRIK